MITMKDVAKRAGVSITTVSRVMNDRGAISSKTRKKVLSTMEELNYFPNEMARSLMTNKTHIIGLIVPTVDHPYFSAAVDHIESMCAAEGYKLLLCTSDHSYEKEKKMSAILRANKVDGVLLYSQGKEAQEYVNYELPVIAIDTSPLDVPSVFCNNYQGGSLAAKTLIECGCINPVVFGFEDSEIAIGQQRINGFCDECTNSSIDYGKYIIERKYYRDNQIDVDFEIHLHRMMEQFPEIDGLFTTNEILATKAILHLHRMGKSVPEDIQVMGYDGTTLSDIVGITTIAQPIEEMCALALDLLFKLMEDKIVPSSSILPVQVIRRGSTFAVNS